MAQWEFSKIFIESFWIWISFKENVEYCLLGDQNKKLTKMKVQRHNIELMNDNLRKLFSKSSEKVCVFFYFCKYDLFFQILSNSSGDNQQFVVRFEWICLFLIKI